MKEIKYTVKYTTGFKKDYKRAIKRGLKIELLEQVVALLAIGEPLPDKNRDHDLPVWRLGRPSRMSHSPGLAACLPHRR